MIIWLSRIGGRVNAGIGHTEVYNVESPLIALSHVTKRYVQGTHAVEALRDVSLTVAPGECVAVMGTSGSGKSTLLNLIGCIDLPTEGTVSIAGQPTSRLSDAELTNLRRDKVGMIFQFFNLLGTLTARQNVALPLLLAGTSPQAAWERADTLLALVGLKERATHRPYQLSGGEMQRVAIARALANNPDVLLADEPTGNLDSRTGSEILSLLTAYCRDQQKTLLLATHDHGAAALTDRVIALRDGVLQS
ncbi:MAG TPA: ABC transporter ATP-binding protein [Alphaproteobacteria bacterium]|nr:ABC transporter ATP-binding protein [Alphaproteobacteria bacterium]